MHLQPLSPAYSPWSPGIAGVYGLSAGEGQRIALQTVSSAGSIAMGTAPLWAATTTTSATGATTVAMASWAIPVIGAAVAGITLALVAWFNRKGPKQKVQTTQIVNELEPMLQQNLAGYLSGPRTVTSQAQALANFDAVWNALVENCRIEEMGDPGVRCVTDRQAGSCQWKEGGQCWNWFVGYRDPIANDPGVKPDPTIGQEVGSTLSQLTGGLIPTTGSGGLLLIGAVALLVFAFSSGGGK
jgi:hypothetical protein